MPTRTIPRAPEQTVLALTDACVDAAETTALVDVTFVVVDLETTGGSPATDRITEIGAVKVRGGDRLGVFSTLVHPGVAIPREITRVTGIADHHVAGHPPIGAVLPSWVEFARGAVLVAHSARFDVGFLNAALRRHGHPPHDQVVVDTVALARRLVRDEVRNLRLATLANHLRARVAPCHRALPDAQATVDVLHALLERAGSLGADTLDELVDLCRVTSLPAYSRIELVRDAPRAAGVYRFVDRRGEVLYVGKATDLRSRLRTYFGRDPRRRIGEMVRRTERVEWDLAPTPLEAEVREVREIGRTRPAYNRRSRDPGRRVHLAPTREPFPRLVATTAVGAAQRAVLGPMPRRRAVALAEAATEAFGLRTCTPRLRVRQDHPACALKELGTCAAPCDGTQGREDYGRAVTAAVAALAEDPSPLLDQLADQMAASAAGGRFERAAKRRDQRRLVADQVDRWRRTAAVTRVARIVATRPTASDEHGWDVVELRHGRLARSWFLPRRPATLDDLVLAAELDTVVANPPVDLTEQVLDGTEVEEVGLVLRWLEGPGLRLLAVDGEWTHPVPGARAVADVLDESSEPRANRRGR